MIPHFNWRDYSRNRFMVPVDDMTRFKALDTQHADCYNAEGRLHKPEIWRCWDWHWERAHAIYIEFENVSRVYYKKSKSLFSFDDISECVEFVYMLSQCSMEKDSIPQRGKVIMTYIPKCYGDMYRLESGACLFLSHRHPCKEIRAQSFINALYLDKFEMDVGIKNYTTEYPQAEAPY